MTPAGEGTVAVMHQYVTSDTHLNRTGQPDHLGREAFHVVSLESGYGLTERLALEGSLLWVATQWTGPVALRHGPIDTGLFHGALQDVRVAARYQLTSGRTSMTTFAGVVVPSHAYETRGHSAFGRRLRELELGFNIGRSVPWLPGNGYVYGSGSYAVSQKVEGTGLNLNHANGDFEIGSSFGRRVGVRGFGNWQMMWDGLELGPLDHHFEHLREIHDRLARSSYLKLGGGGTFKVSERATLSVSAYATAIGRNIHSVRAIVSAVTWDIGGGFRVRPE